MGKVSGKSNMTLVLNSTVCHLNRRFFSQSQSLRKMVARPLVLCGPSGVGKSTIVERLKKRFPDAFALSVSHTTRQPREGEKDGVNYFFTDRETMKAAIENGDFLETAEFSGNMYGTSKAAVETVSVSGKICILDIDRQGVIQIKETNLNPLYVFIHPPSVEDIEKRLRGRGTETEESLQKRLSAAKVEMEYGTLENFNKVVVNDDIDKVEEELVDFLNPHIEELKLEQDEKAD